MEVLEGVDSGAVVVGPVDSEGVVSNEFGAEGGEGFGVVAGEDAEEGFALFLLLAELFALGAGAHRSQIGDAVDGVAAVGPVDFELLVFFEV